MKILRVISFQVPSPIALFYLNDADDLLPIAIQLYQDKPDKNPVSDCMSTLIQFWRL